MHALRRFVRPAALCLLAAAVPAFADWPQYRGPTHDGISAEKMLAAWPAGGPAVLWKKDIGHSLSSFAIKDGRAYYVSEVAGQNEAIFAVNLKTGEQFWTDTYDKTSTSSSGLTGPHSTPVADTDKVYVYSSFLKLICYNAADGKILWRHDIQSEFAGQARSARAISSWQSATSPVIDGDLVIVMGGGPNQSIIAFQKATGEVAWKLHDEEMTQSTPTLVDIGGIRQLIFFTNQKGSNAQTGGLVSINPQDGRIHWRTPFTNGNKTAIAVSPVVYRDPKTERTLIYASIGYNTGAAGFEVKKSGEKLSANKIWPTSSMTQASTMSQWTTPVVKDGYLYTIHGGQNDTRAPLQCLDMATGKIMWTGPAVGQGQMILVDGKLIVQDRTGRLLLINPDPAKYTQISAAQPIAGDHAWGLPAFSDGILLYHTDRQVAAVDLRPPE